MAKTFNAAESMLKKDLEKTPEKKATRTKKEEKKEIKSEAATLILRPSTKEALKEMAYRERRSFNDFVGEILENYVKKNWKE